MHKGIFETIWLRLITLLRHSKHGSVFLSGLRVTPRMREHLRGIPAATCLLSVLRILIIAPFNTFATVGHVAASANNNVARTGNISFNYKRAF